MQLISILLFIVGILTFLSSVVVFFGSSRSDRPLAAWYSLAALFSTIWLATIGFFLNAKTESLPFITFLVNSAFISSLMANVCFFGFGAWNRRVGKPATLIFLLTAIFLSVAIVAEPDLLYTNIALAATGNTIDLVIGPLLIVYILYFAAIVPFIIAAFCSRYRKARSKNKRIGNFVVMVCYSLSGILSLIANLILPLSHNWSLSWLGPLGVSIVILSIYYMILRYRAVNLSYVWLRIFSYVIIVSSIAIIYMIIFSIIFAALFRGSTPSIEVIILNFVMLLIFISMLPAMSNFIRWTRRLILEQHPQHIKHLDEKEKKTKP